jgi:hypothetical protein
MEKAYSKLKNGFDVIKEESSCDDSDSCPSEDNLDEILILTELEDAIGVYKRD